jgi:ADP-heptose:LPS heptosyltransferase
VHPGALGDVVLAVPALRALRVSVADRRLIVAAQPRLGALLAALGVADEAHDLDALGLDALFTDDATLQPRLPGVERLVCWLGARDPVFARRLRAIVSDAVVAPSIGDRDLVWRHLLETIGSPPGDWRASIPLTTSVAAQGAEVLRAAGWDGKRRVMIVHPGASGPAKRWAVEGFAAALAEVPRDVTVVVHQGPTDADAAHGLLSRRGEGLLLREPALPALAGALARASGYVGNDSGVSHLAAAVGTRAVVLFASENLKWRPWADGVRVLTVTAGQATPADVTAVSGEVGRLLA